MHLAHPVARVYAEALFGIAKERHAVQDTLEELEVFVGLGRQHENVRRFLTSPVLEPQVKIKHLRAAFEGRWGTALDRR